MRLFVYVTGAIWLLAALLNLHSLATRVWPYTKVERNGGSTAVAVVINLALAVWAVLLLFGGSR